MKAFLLGWAGVFFVVALMGLFWGVPFYLSNILISSFSGALVGAAAAHIF